MGVAGPYRGQGIGRRLTRAALGLAAAEDCGLVALNATGEGEPLYRGAGFRSAGWGDTWWWFG
jgi:GNAT superfamily N-acetyltransferase